MGNHLPRFLMLYGGLWNDITTSVSQTDKLKISTGASEISDAPRPAKLEMTLLDPNSVYRPYLATSPLYGLAGRNTPVTVVEDGVYEDWEDTTYNVTWGQGVEGSSAPWARSSTSPHSGSWCMKSGAVAASQFSDLVIEAPADANACFLWYRTDSDASDIIRINTGGVVRYTASGTGGVWKQAFVPLVVSQSTGNRQVYVRYQKDAATVAGADAVYVDDVQFVRARITAEVTSWEPDRTLGFNPAVPNRGRQWTDVTAEGLLARLGTWTEPVQSALSKQILGYSNLVGYWPMDDGREATRLTNLAPGGKQGSLLNVNLDDEEAPGGGSTSIKLDTTSALYGPFANAAVNGWQFSVTFRLGSIPASPTGQNLVWWRTTNAYRWFLSVSSGAYSLDVSLPDGTSLASVATGFGTGAEPNQWITMRVKASDSGGTLSWEMAWYPENGGATYGASGSFAGAAGRLQGWRIDSNTNLTGAWIAGVYGVFGVADNLLSNDAIAAFNGYVGETAGARMTRLMKAAGLAFTMVGFSSATEPMGPQRPDSLLNLLRECRDTDGGLLYDSRNQIGIDYRTRASLYNQSAKAFSVTHMSSPLQPVLDTQNAYNVVSASQRDGGTATVSDTTSLLSTNSPPAGIGTKKLELDVNVSNETRLQDLAYWALGIGTVPDARYRAVTVDCDAAPSMEATASGMSPGDRLTISGLDPDLVDLMMIGMVDSQTTQKRRTITFTCVPYRQFLVGLYDTLGLYDSASTTLATSESTTDPSWAITTANLGDVWSTVDLPYRWIVAGEVVTVTAMTAAAGTGPYTQTATVTRSTNGVVKIHAAGEEVHVVNPGRLAL